MMAEATMFSYLSPQTRTSLVLFIMCTKTDHLSCSVQSTQSTIDILLMDKLDQVSSNLANLLVSLLEDGADPPSAW